MSALEKAELQVLDRRGNPTGTHPVQFNPTTMQLQMANSIDGARSRGRQRQQYNGTSSTTLSIDLEYDTADEGTDWEPVDVRTKTQDVRQFVLPGGANAKQAPPRVKFRWGTFELTGVMASLTEDLSLFSAEGVPLRAKVSIQIKEQDPKFEALERGPGANPDTSPPPSGEDAAGSDAGQPGGPPDATGPLDAAVDALDGETPSDFLARNGLAPEAWRAIGGLLDAAGDGIELSAGASIGFNSSLGVGLGLGVSLGFEAGLDLSVEAALGLEASASATGRVGGRAAELQQGRALAASGGVTAAAESSKNAVAEAATAAALTSFDQQGPPAASPTVSTASTAVSSRGPLSTGTVGPTLRSGDAPGAPAPPASDARASSFGRGIPLNERITPPGSDDECYVVLGRRSPIDAAVPVAGRRPAPWEQLAPSGARDDADRAQAARRPPCGCHRCDPLGKEHRR